MVRGLSKILLDTDIIIENLRGNEAIFLKIKGLKDEKAIFYVSPVSIAEVYAGIRKGEEKLIADFFNSVTCLPISDIIAIKAGEYLRLFSRSHGLEIGDALVAAVSFHNQARLLTLNKKHYPMRDIGFI